MEDNSNITSDMIKSKAIEIGFNAVGISKVEPIEGFKTELKEWLQLGYNASMQYMERNIEKRCNPALLVENSVSIISLLTSYYPKQKQAPDTPQISKYAYGEDYHDVIKQKMTILWDYIKLYYPTLEGRIFVDSAPVNDRHWAKQSGLGWIGKNSCLINRNLGSFAFISELIVNLPLQYDTPFTENHCGNCTLCIDNCPTKAIIKPGVIDSNKCISFQTIENKLDEIPKNVSSKISNQIFGCDICQDICPWNKKAKSSNFDELNPKDELLSINYDDWKNMDTDRFNMLFKKSALKRTKLSGIKRNLKSIKEL